MGAVQVLSALLTPLLGVIATAVLVYQYQLQRLRWRLDMWEKRFPVYLTTMDYIKHAVQDATLTFEEVFKFDRESKDRAFLFKRDVEAYLGELSQRGLELYELDVSLKGVPEGDRRDKLEVQRRELLKWFREQFEVSKILFGKYLRIGKK